MLVGGGLEGRGEDVTYAAEDHDDYPADLPLAGEWTLDGFSRHLGGLDLFPGRPPQQEFFRNYRRWGFESAALDLALRQSKLNLGEALARPYAPVRFVLSTRLDIKPWLAVDPSLEFKLDPTPEWDEGLMRDIAATGRVRALDFKSFYTGSPVDNPPGPGAVPAGERGCSPARCSRIRRWRARRARCCAGRRGASASTRPSTPGRTSRRCESASLPRRGPECDRFELRQLNVKPSRFGSMSALLDCVGRAQAAGIVLYGGGQFELGIGRDQIQALASLLYPAGPNDVAPREYHGEAHAGCRGARSCRSRIRARASASASRSRTAARRGWAGGTRTPRRRQRSSSRPLRSRYAMLSRIAASSSTSRMTVALLARAARSTARASTTPRPSGR